MRDLLVSRPLIIATIFFVAGISWTATDLYCFPFLVAAFFLIICLLGCFQRKRKSFFLLLYPLPFFFIAIVHTLTSPAGPEKLEMLRRSFPEKKEALISGRLLASPEIGTKNSKLLIAADHLFLPENNPSCFKTGKLDNGTGLISSEARLVNVKVLLRMQGSPPPAVFPGDRLLIRTTLSRPDRYNTPGSFDYPAYLARKSIHLQGWIQSASHMIELQSGPGYLPVRQEFLIIAEKFRHKINNFIENNLSTRTAGLYKAILTGDRGMVKPEILENFKKTGAMHLMAISGVHMGLLALCCGLGFNFLVRRSERVLLYCNTRKIVCLLTIPVLLAYALIAGFKPPVLRALIMTIIFFMAIINDRQHHLPTHISIAALVILLINPQLLFAASFQLSFAAVIGITVVLPKARQLIAPALPTGKQSVPKRLLHWLIAGLMVSVAASLTTAPLLVYYFNRFSPISPLTTLLVEPLICFWSLITGLISCPLIFIFPGLAATLLKIGSTGLKGADLITGKLAEIPFADIWLSTPSLPEIAFYYLLLATLFLGRKRSPARYLIITLSATVLISYPLYCKYQRTHRDYDKISFLDVGQGCSAVLEMQDGTVTIIDGGGPFSQNFNVGRAVIAPYLWEQRINKINQLTISHLDSDHYNGLPFIVQHFRPDKIWLNDPDPGGSATINSLLEVAQQKESALEVPEQGEILITSRQTSILKNIAGLHLGSGFPEDNNRSLILRLTTNGYSFLFPGDIEKKAERQLLDKGRDVEADVLLAPHHGSIGSSSEDFVKAVSPDCTVISAGKYRNNIFPAPEVLDIYRDLGSKVFTTSAQGTVTFRTGESGLKIETFREN
ncbi:MAG: DNA internalization-related competence protein ComEC/Rec2 [Desulfobia sp.]